MWRYNLLLIALFVIVEGGKSRYNSQYTASGNWEFIDMTGDGIDEIYFFSGNTLYVTTSEADIQPITYLKLSTTPSKVIGGFFQNENEALLCVQVSSKLDCYSLQTTNKVSTLKLKVSLPDTIGSYDAAVGTFNGDKIEDILVFSNGAVPKVLTWSSESGDFIQMANWNADGLPSYVRYNYRVGEFDVADGISDISAEYYTTYQQSYYDYYYQVYRYNTVYTYYIQLFVSELVSGKYTLKLKSSSPLYNSGVTVAADLTGDGIDELIIWTSGSLLAYSSNSSNTPLNVNITYSTASGSIKFARLQIPKPQLGLDLLIFKSDNTLVRESARSTTSIQYGVDSERKMINPQGDTDGDSIIDAYELGTYVNSKGVNDGLLNSYGASVFKKDIFVQVDYMAGPKGVQWDYSLSPEAIDLATKIMAEKDITLHIFQENKVAFKDNLALKTQANWEDDFYEPYKDTSPTWTEGREEFFHYCLMARQINYGYTTGQSAAIVHQDFVVSLMTPGCHFRHLLELTDACASTDLQAGTFLHELGHNLGLYHGGLTGDEVSWKPNHLSIMNYNFQLTGVFKEGFKHLYSEMQCQDINENSIDENKGIICTVDGSTTYSTKIKHPDTKLDMMVPINSPVDWNGDGKYEKILSYDIDGDGKKSVLRGATNEYNQLRFDGIKQSKKKRSTAK